MCLLLFSVYFVYYLLHLIIVTYIVQNKSLIDNINSLIGSDLCSVICASDHVAKLYEMTFKYPMLSSFSSVEFQILYCLWN